jgi:hypothetical protein
MKKWFLILLLAALPAAGATAQENEVVPLPAVSPLETVEVSAAADYSTASLEEYYRANFYMDREDYQAPRMTAEERERAEALLVDYQAGARPTENVLDKLENAVVGVYTLNPGDYEGETLFTLLPVDPLTDEQILEVIDAFAQCGRTFDPEALSYRNCMRGGGIEATRFFQEDEQTRRTVLRELYIRQGLTVETAFTPSASDDGMGMATLDPDAYCGLEEFLFLPCRRMTDDELLRYMIYREGGDPADFGNYPAYEKALRAELRRVAGAPLVLTLEYENTGRMGDSNISYDDERVYTASFTSADGVSYWGALDVDTGKVLTVQAWQESSLSYSDLHLNPFDEKWLELAKEAVLAARVDDVKIAYAESRGESWLSNVGYGVLVKVVMDDGGVYTIQIAFQNGAVHGGLFYESHGPNLERMYPDEMFGN